jgi:hypothetical protein
MIKMMRLMFSDNLKLKIIIAHDILLIINELPNYLLTLILNLNPNVILVITPIHGLDHVLIMSLISFIILILAL